ncbi:MAG: DUF3800 domain-containing protein [Phycisphaerae bacterium]
MQLGFQLSTSVDRQMLAFVDESGDTGLKLGQGSSRYFTVTTVIFECNLEAETCAREISALRSRLGIRREFKFNKCRIDVREEFLRTVSMFQFAYSSMVINKAKLSSKGFGYKTSFFKCALNYCFQNCLDTLNEASVFIDGQGDKDFRRSLQAYLKKQTRRKDGTQRIKKVRTQDSHRSDLLQMADMVCGAVARSFRDDVSDRFAYRKIIERHELRVQFWPK